MQEFVVSTIRGTGVVPWTLQDQIPSPIFQHKGKQAFPPFISGQLEIQGEVPVPTEHDNGDFKRRISLFWSPIFLKSIRQVILDHKEI